MLEHRSRCSLSLRTKMFEKKKGSQGLVTQDVVQSILMIASFLTIPVVVAAEYGWLPAIGPSDCGFLRPSD